MDSQPYDNVEFPIRRPAGAGTWSSTAQNTSTKLYSQNILAKDKQASTLEPLLEGDGGEVIDEDAELPQVEDQRQQATTLIANQNKKETNIDMNRGVYVPVVVIEQPRPLTETFTRNDFNPRSQNVVEDAYTRHSKFYKFNEKLMSQADEMKKEVWDVKGKPGEMLTYEQMIQGMLVDGEMLLLGGSWLYFSNLEFLDTEYKNSVKPPIGKGRLCLTNQRLLILSAETDTDASLSTYGDPITTKGGYKLALSKFNNIYFQNIPLSCFLNVELSAVVGTSEESRISYQKPLCCGLCSCFGKRCSDSWKASHPLPIPLNRRTVTLGASMPPWQTQTSIVVHLHPEMPLTAARDFVSQLQQHAPTIPS
ncbi:hypothetical protein KUTeg_014233 [Tegillarca granosa]|uniref:Uncharacterized protein n=1 Tax=Tegillarca granosa TaxID=220873 RepID=A0ABQ9EWD6_TEGGR|nr:hypothetical protein KUTeg_014233 [Tegillarca granosa]